MIELLGREDGQVKIHGHRIELGEIEAHLAALPAVAAAAVTAPGPREERTLVAYVVAAPGAGAEAAPGALRRALAARLPRHMVPERWVFLPALPLSANGKVDRRALPPPETAAAPGGAVPAAAAADGLAERVRRAIAGVLGREVDAGTDLLAAGADSVAMVRIANRLEVEIGFRPGFDQLYRFPTAAGLAALAGRSGAAPEGSGDGAPDGAGGGAPPAFDLLLDPAERAAFVRRRPGLRADLDGRGALALPGAAGADDLRALRSYREFLAEPIPLARFGRLLGALAAGPWKGAGGAGQGNGAAGAAVKRLYPSASGLYPVQVYLHVRPGRVEGVAGGVYYHDPAAHRLVEIGPGADLDPAIHHRLVNRPVFERAAFSLFLVARLAAIAPLYGDAARAFATLEAGYLGQLLRQRGAETAIGLCPIGEVDFARVRDLFALAPGDELVHSLVGGAVDPGQPWAPVDSVAAGAGAGATPEYEEGTL